MERVRSTHFSRLMVKFSSSARTFLKAPKETLQRIFQLVHHKSSIISTEYIFFAYVVVTKYYKYLDFSIDNIDMIVNNSSHYVHR